MVYILHLSLIPIKRIGSKMKKRLFIYCFILVASIFQSVFANTLYMANGGGARSTTETSWLYSIDTESMLITPIGDIGFHVADLAWDATSGILYAATSIHDPVHNGLIKIDTNTGVGTSIGINGWGTGVTTTGQRGEGAATHVVFIDVDSSGNMFGGGKALHFGGEGEGFASGSKLLKINKINGTFSYIGTINEGDNTENTLVANHPLFFDDSDKLWVKEFGYIFEMDPLTGAAEFSRSISFVDGGVVIDITGGTPMGGDIKSHGAFDRESGFYWEVELSPWSTSFMHKYDVSGGAGFQSAESIIIPNGNIVDYLYKQPALAFAYENTQLSDIDSDGIADVSDNCIEASNANQFDSDGDGYGNMCDPDINNDGRVDEWDWYLAYGFSEDYDPYEEDDGDDRFLDYYLPDADINGDGLNNHSDRQYFDAMNDQFGPSAFH